MVSQTCKTKSNEFCFCCAKYIKVKQRRQFDEKAQTKYKKAFKLNSIKNLNQLYTPTVICITCSIKISSASARNDENFKMRPVIWHKPASDHKDCYLCNIELTLSKRRYPKKIEYNENLSCTFPRAQDAKMVNVHSNHMDQEDSQ